MIEEALNSQNYILTHIAKGHKLFTNCHQIKMCVSNIDSTRKCHFQNISINSGMEYGQEARK